MQKCLSLWITILCLVQVSFSQNFNFGFKNTPITSPEINNYGRGAQYWNGTSWNNSSAPQVPNGTSDGKTYYQRYEWTSMENGMGQYTLTGNWPSLEYTMKYAADHGMLFAFGGVMTAYDGAHGKYYDGAWSVYPEYLHQMMQAESATPDWKYTSTGNWIPNWNSPSYLSRWRALNDTIYNFIMNWSYTPGSGPWAGKKVKGKEFFDYVDIRGYGNFGEWHTYPWTNQTPANAVITDSSMKKLIDITRDIYNNQQLMGLIAIFDDNSWSESNAWRAYYMLTSSNNYGLFGWRRDNIGDKGYDNFLIGNTWVYGSWRADTAILNRWKYGMISGEPLNGSGSGNCCPIYYHIRPEVGSYHYAGFGNGNYGVNTSAAWDTIREDFKITGYRYNLNGGYMTNDLLLNQNFQIGLNWRNVGASPIYQKRWRVSYELKTQADAVLKKWTISFNPYLFLPSTRDSVVAETLDLSGVPAGTNYKFTLKIEDTTGLCSPLYLAVDSPSRNTDGSYTLRSNITVYSALPIVWYSFSGTQKTNYIDLNWSLACESDVERFDVFRSEDGTVFWKIGEITNVAAGSPCNYNYKDYDLTYPKVFYKVKAINRDGTFSNSRIIGFTVSLDKLGSGFRILNTATSDQFFLESETKDKGQMVITLFSIDGKRVRQLNMIKNTDKLVVPINISDLSTGLYLINVTLERRNLGTKKILRN